MEQDKIRELFGGKVNIEQIDLFTLFIGIMNMLNNRFQATADAMFEEISWKQSFVITCITLFPEAPTIRELTTLIGGTHQNTKQLLDKLEKSGYISMRPDEKDKRKQRIFLNEKSFQIMKKYDEPSRKAMGQMFSGIEKRQLESAVSLMLQLTENMNNI